MNHLTRRTLVAGGLLAASFLASPYLASDALAADDHVKPITAMVPQLRALVTTPNVIAAVKTQNTKHAALTQADIDRLDRQWRQEVSASSRPLIDSVMAAPVSAEMKSIQTNSKGLITEIFVMDAKGLNVGQSEVTSDYWQGDEAKFKRSFDVGPSAVFVDKIEQDESTQEFQAQLSFTLVDPAGDAAIGAVTIGISIERLAQ